MKAFPSQADFEEQGSVATMAPDVAKVRRIQVPAGEDPNAVARGVATTTDEPAPMQSRHATLLTDATPETEKPAEATATDWLSEFSEEERTELGQLGSPQEVAKAYLHARRKVTQTAQERAGLERQVADIVQAQLNTKGNEAGRDLSTPKEFLQPVENAPDLAALQEEVGKTFLDDIGGSVKKIMEAAIKTARAEVQRGVQPLIQQQAVREVKAIADTHYPGLVTTESAKDIDAFASLAPGETPTEKYRHALERYAKLVGYEAPGKKSEPGAVERPSGPAPTAHSKPTKKVTYTSAHLTHLLLHEPEKYRRMQPEIMAAYAEGRVK